MKPPDKNPDGTEKFIPKTKLMLKLDEIVVNPDEECSDDALDNSFDEEYCFDEEEETSSSSSEEEDDDDESPSPDQPGDEEANDNEESPMPQGEEDGEGEKEGEGEGEDEEEDEDADEDEDEEDEGNKMPAQKSLPAPMGQRRPVVNRPMNKTPLVKGKTFTNTTKPLPEVVTKKEEATARKVRLRKNMINVNCTEYEIVPKVAKQILNC